MCKTHFKFPSVFLEVKELFKSEYHFYGTFILSHSLLEYETTTFIYFWK